MAHILLIDDDDGIRNAASRYLRMLGHEVTEAGDGARALRLAQGSPVDLVITDINMPEMDGIEVILAVTENKPGVPVIAISGGGRMPKDVLLASAGLLGAVETLAKPFELSELMQAVERGLASRTGRGGHVAPRAPPPEDG